MNVVPPLPRPDSGGFIDAYTRGLTTTELERLFTRDAPDAYRFFFRNIDYKELDTLPWYRRSLRLARLFYGTTPAQARSLGEESSRLLLGTEPKREVVGRLLAGGLFIFN